MDVTSKRKPIDLDTCDSSSLSVEISGSARREVSRRACPEHLSRVGKMGEKTWNEGVTTPWVKSNYGLGSSTANRQSQRSPSAGKGMSAVAQHRVASKLCQLKQRDGICHLTREEIHRIWNQAARIQPVETAHVDSLSSFMNQCTKHLEMLPSTFQAKTVPKTSPKKEVSALHAVSRLADTAVAKSISHRIKIESSEKTKPTEVRQLYSPGASGAWGC